MTNFEVSILVSITGKEQTKLDTIGQYSSKLEYIKTNQKTRVIIEITRAYFRGASRTRTGDLLTASQVLSQAKFQSLAIYSHNSHNMT